MEKPKLLGKGSLPGFVTIQLGKEFILKCHGCSKAWAAQVPDSGKTADIDGLTLYNIRLHAKKHQKRQRKILRRAIRRAKSVKMGDQVTA